MRQTFLSSIAILGVCICIEVYSFDNWVTILAKIQTNEGVSPISYCPAGYGLVSYGIDSHRASTAHSWNYCRCDQIDGGLQAQYVSAEYNANLGCQCRGLCLQDADTSAVEIVQATHQGSTGESLGGTCSAGKTLSFIRMQSHNAGTESPGWNYCSCDQLGNTVVAQLNSHKYNPNYSCTCQGFCIDDIELDRVSTISAKNTHYSGTSNPASCEDGQNLLVAGMTGHNIGASWGWDYCSCETEGNTVSANFITNNPNPNLGCFCGGLCIDSLSSSPPEPPHPAPVPKPNPSQAWEVDDFQMDEMGEDCTNWFMKLKRPDFVYVQYDLGNTCDIEWTKAIGSAELEAWKRLAHKEYSIRYALNYRQGTCENGRLEIENFTTGTKWGLSPGNYCETEYGELFTLSEEQAIRKFIELIGLFKPINMRSPVEKYDFCDFVVSPSDNYVSVIESIVSEQNMQYVCFRPGVYTRPFSIEDKHNLAIVSPEKQSLLIATVTIAISYPPHATLFIRNSENIFLSGINVTNNHVFQGEGLWQVSRAFQVINSKRVAVAHNNFTSYGKQTIQLIRSDVRIIHSSSRGYYFSLDLNQDLHFYSAHSTYVCDAAEADTHTMIWAHNTSMFFEDTVFIFTGCEGLIGGKNRFGKDRMVFTADTEIQGNMKAYLHRNNGNNGTDLLMIGNFPLGWPNYLRLNGTPTRQTRVCRQYLNHTMTCEE